MLQRTSSGTGFLVVAGVLRGTGGLTALFQAAYFASVQAVGVSLATLLTIGVSPVLVLIVEGVTGRRRIGPGAAATATLAVVGLVLLVGARRGDHRPALRGRPGRPGPGDRDRGRPDRAGLRGVLPRPAHRPAGTASLMALLEPLIGTGLAALVLGDRLSPIGLAGAALLLLALVLEPVVRDRARHRPRRGMPDPRQRDRPVPVGHAGRTARSSGDLVRPGRAGLAAARYD